jgi:hypothetical protein
MSSVSQHHETGNFESWANIPPRIQAILERECIGTPDQWLAAGRRRLLIFGITRRIAAQLDALARDLGREP